MKNHGVHSLLPGELPAGMGRAELEKAQAMNASIREYAIANGWDVDHDVYEHDNRNVSYRNDTEPRLLVRRAPHQVRTAVETGVVYAVDEATHTLEIGLNDPPDPDHYLTDALDWQTQHTLCLPCQDAFNYYCLYRDAKLSDSKVEMSNAVVHHQHLFSLYGWVGAGNCFVCRNLSGRLKAYFGERLNTTRLGDFRTEMYWSESVNLEKKDKLWFVLTDPKEPKSHWNCVMIYLMNVWPNTKYGDRFHWPRISKPVASHHNKSASDNTGSWRSQRLALAWFQNCIEHPTTTHRECDNRDRTFLPTRLLDLSHARKTGSLRLVTRDSIDGQPSYVTLSHCWGKNGQLEDPLLKEENMLSRQSVGLPLSDLPKTFRHAVDVASWFSVDWLWIDSMCIVQDSSSDWLREAFLMSQIYKNSMLNISAEVGADSRAGCFSDRDELDITPIAFRSRSSQQSFSATPHRLILIGKSEQTPSFNRAWIHREGQLARRILRFTAEEMSWECCGTGQNCFASERFPRGAPFETGLYGLNSKYQIGRLQTGLEVGAEETYATWNDVCERLSTKKLTNPEDLPIVLSGMAEEFSHLLPSDQFIAGLWRSTLPQSLMWEAEAIRSRNLPYIAPSWSWLAQDRKVSLANRSNIDKTHAVTRITDIDVKPKYSDPFGPVLYGTLSMTGFVRHLSIEFTDHRLCDITLLDDGKKGDGGSRKVGESWRKFEGEMCEYAIDATLPSATIQCHCLFVTIKQMEIQGSERGVGGLLLRQVAEGTFERMGAIDFGDLFALKMRYRTRGRVVEDEEWGYAQARIKSFHDKRKEEDKGGEGSSRRGRNLVDDDLGKPFDGPSILYQYDEALAEDNRFEKLTMQTLTII